jgi:DNA mismatch repair protein MLH3
MVETTTRMAFTKESLQTARVIAQIDSKFVCCVLDSDGHEHNDNGRRQPRERGRGLRTLVLIDQHAADERISIEAILRDLCLGFIRNDPDTVELSEPLGVVLTGEEAGLLAQEGAIEVFRRWGIGVSGSQFGAGIDPAIKRGSRTHLGASEMRGEMEYIQVAITHVPTTLKGRLGKKGGMELSRLVKLYLEQVLRDDLEELRSLCSSLDSSRGLNDPGPESEMEREREREREKDWGTVMRWMPKEMLELTNSKACRGGSISPSYLL